MHLINILYKDRFSQESYYFSGYVTTSTINPDTLFKKAFKKDPPSSYYLSCDCTIPKLPLSLYTHER